MEKLKILIQLKIAALKMTSINEGNFKLIPISDWEREMLEDAYQAVTKAKRWDFLRRTDVPGPNGFMLSDWPQMKEIDSFMEYQGHSGASYGCTMRVMEAIAKRGWDVWVRETYPPNAPEKQKKKTSLENFVNTLERDPVARQLIPDFDKQAEAMKKFSQGNLSYAEMRSICG
jgi:hypothetical protein